MHTQIRFRRSKYIDIEIELQIDFGAQFEIENQLNEVIADILALYSRHLMKGNCQTE